MIADHAGNAEREVVPRLIGEQERAGLIEEAFGRVEKLRVHLRRHDMRTMS